MLLKISLTLLLQLQVKPGIRVVMYGCVGHVVELRGKRNDESVRVAVLPPAGSREDVVYGDIGASGDITVVKVIRQHAF